MIVAGIQMDIAWEDPDRNFLRVNELAKGVMTGPGPAPRLLVLPEMFATGFSMDARKVSAFAQITRDFLAGLASRFSVFVLGGYAEPAEPMPANACSIFAPGGEEILHFRKLHPFSMGGEDENYIGGESVETADVEGVRVTPFICYDLRFPEPFRPPSSTTDLYCVIANWPDKRREAWSGLLRARAIENQAFVLGVNRVGLASDMLHAGDSALMNPMGHEMAGVEEYQEGVVLGEVDPREVAKTRRHLGFLKDRRPKLYQRLENDLS